MKVINSFQITDMMISGFKSYCEPASFHFDNPTIITGGNGKGKSSIADAIAFAVTGLPFFGERGIDRLHCDSNGDLYIRMGFVDGDGDKHELTRTRRGNHMNITFDGYDIRQLDLTEMFGEKDVFLSIVNPLYFIEELGDSGKSLLERYLPPISHEEVMAELSSDVRESLKVQKFLSPEAYLKRLREKIRDLDESVIYLTGQKDMAENQRREHLRVLSETTEKADILAAEISLLQHKQYAGLDTFQMKEQLVELSSRYDEVAQDSGNDELTEKAIAELHRKMGARSAEKYISRFTDALAEAKALVKDLAVRYAKEVTAYKSFRPGTSCPVCHRSVTEENLSEVQAVLKSAISEIAAEGKERKAQLDELLALDAKSKETFEQFQQDDLKTMEAEIQTLAPQNAAASDEGVPKLEQLRVEIQNLTATLEYGNLTQAEYDRLRECLDRQRKLESELTALKNISGKADTDHDTRIKEAQEQTSRTKKLVSHMALYLAKRAEMTFSALKLNRVAISLYDVIKTTGEVKEAFRFTYGGRRYDRLSLSEKVRAGMEVSELMKRLTGRNYPVFVDNIESIEDLANVRPLGQIIMAKMVPGAELSVKGKPRTAEQNVAA